MLRDSLFLVIGAVLAGLVGYVTSLIRDFRKAGETRRALATSLHAELSSIGLIDDPIFRDPKSAKRIKLVSLDQLLAPGVLDPKRHTFLIANLFHLSRTIEEFNERAYLFDLALANGVSGQQLQDLYIQLQMSTRDYQDAYGSVLCELWLVGPPFPFSEIGQPNTLKDRLYYWRIRKQRQLWIENENDDF